MSLHIAGLIRYRRLGLAWNAGNHLDLKIKSGEPVDAHSRPVRIRRLFKNLFLHCHERFKLVLWISVERCYVDNVIEPASCCGQRRF